MTLALVLLAAGGCVAREGGPWYGTGVGSPPRLSAEAWPTRLDRNTALGPDPSQALLLSPRSGPPEERKYLGSYGVGDLYRIDVEELVEADQLARFREERGFREWLVFQTYLRSLDSDLQWAGPMMQVTDVPDGPVRVLEVSETSFAIYLPQGKPRGLVVQFTNLAGNTDWERQLTAEFRARGWAVLSTFVPDGWAVREALELDRNDDPHEIGVRIAEAVDDRLAEWAFGVEALLDYLGATYPDIPLSPMIGLGSSAGAISLPAVAARLDRPFDCSVLIGGGIDALSVLRWTTLSTTPFRLVWEDSKHPTAAQWTAIQKAFESSTRLDGIKTASYLRQSPTLLLHAKWDRIVDARCGDRLWEVLDYPERWCYPAGHLGLFILWVPQDRARIADWVEAQIDAAGPAAGPADGVAPIP